MAIWKSPKALVNLDSLCEAAPFELGIPHQSECLEGCVIIPTHREAVELLEAASWLSALHKIARCPQF
jgi:hypothetical protein